MAGATFGRRSHAAVRPPTVERARTTWRDPSDAQPRPRAAAPTQAVEPRAAANASRTELSADAQRFLATGQPPSWATATRGGLIAGVLLCGAVLFAMLYSYGSGVVRDHRLAGSWQPALDVKISKAKCKRYWFLVTVCDVGYAWRERGVGKVATASFMVALKSTSGAQLLPVRSAHEPSTVTAQVAADEWLTNRTVSLLGFVLLFAFGVLGCLKGLLTGRYKTGAAYDNLVAELRTVGAAMQPR